MKRFMGLKLLEGFKRKRNIMGEMKNIEDHFCLRYREADEVVL